MLHPQPHQHHLRLNITDRQSVVGRLLHRSCDDETQTSLNRSKSGMGAFVVSFIVGEVTEDEDEDTEFRNEILPILTPSLVATVRDRSSQTQHFREIIDTSSILIDDSEPSELCMTQTLSGSVPMGQSHWQPMPKVTYSPGD